MDRLAISATANGLYHLPEHHASATGLFARARLDVVATAGDRWMRVLAEGGLVGSPPSCAARTNPTKGLLR